jgi:predicted CopG family antitoxin
MMSEDTTAVNVDTRTWRRLNARKRPGESFDDVVDRLLEQNKNDIDIEIASDSDSDTE